VGGQRQRRSRTLAGAVGRGRRRRPLPRGGRDKDDLKGEREGGSAVERVRGRRGGE
jgi:hypothetical protein